MAKCTAVGGFAVLAALTTILAGCGSDSSGSSGAKPVAATEAAPKTPALPKLGAYLPPLDENRVEVAPPAGWQVPPRDSRWLVHFQEQTSSKYPAIMVTADDYGSRFTVSAENVNEFAKKVARERDLSTVKPIQLGKFVGAIYRTRARQKSGISMILDRLFLETVVDGRKYVLELRTRDGSLLEYQPYLFAVATGMKFGSEPEEPVAAEPASKKKPAETAASAEPKPAKAAEKPQGKPGEKPKKTAPEKSPEKAPEESKDKKKPGIDLDKELKGLDDLFK